MVGSRKALSMQLASMVVAGITDVLGSTIALAEAAGCPQSELESAKTNLAKLRRRDCLAVVLRGATGPTAKKVNGTYLPTGEIDNGKPVYVMAGDSSRCLVFSNDKCWRIKNTVKKDEKGYDGNAYTEPGLAHPTQAKTWKVSDVVGWAQQPLEASVMVMVIVRRACIVTGVI